MDQDQINRDLAERSDSVLQTKILNQVRNYLKVAGDSLSQHWTSWEKADQLYRAYRVRDQEDAQANLKGEPGKLIIPVAYAQVQTAVSFIFSTFTQKDYIYELVGRGPEDQRVAMGLQRDLGYQIDRMQFLLHLYLWLLDTYKYGVGIIKCEWDERYETVRVAQPVLPTIFQRAASALGLGKSPSQVYEEATAEILQYEGNKVRVVAPFNFYYDTSLPFARFQEGAFAGNEEVFARSTIENKEGSLYFGTAHIPTELTPDVLQERQRYVTRAQEYGGELLSTQFNQRLGVQQLFVSEVIFSIIPKKWKEETGIDLGDESYPVKFVATIANDRKVIRFEPYGYLHNKFPYAIMEYSPDSVNAVNPGIPETIEELQTLMTWFLNSHVANVRKAIKNRFIGIADRLYSEDIDSNKALIRVKQGTNDLGRVIQQLQVTDVTQNHIRDMETLLKLIQITTGISDNALGMYASGRRSATEMRNVNAGTAVRLRMNATLNWTQGMEPLGKMMLANTRQGRSREVYASILGEDVQKYPFETTILASPNQVAGGFDFKPYDAALPSDNHARAGHLMTLMEVLLKSPDAAQIFDINPKLLLEHILHLFGIHNINDFSLSNQPGVGTLQPSVLPDQQIQEQLAAGQLEGVPTEADILHQLARQPQ